MLTGNELSDFRIKSMGADISGVTEPQLEALSAYRDRPNKRSEDKSPSCESCDIRNEVLCNLSAERLAPAGYPEPTIFVRDALVCKSCLGKELASLRQRLEEIDFIEISSAHWQPSSIVITTEAELTTTYCVLIESDMPTPTDEQLRACGMTRLEFKEAMKISRAPSEEDLRKMSSEEKIRMVLARQKIHQLFISQREEEFLRRQKEQQDS